MAERVIHTKIVMDMTTWEVLEDEFYLYDGPVAECKGGGSSSTNSTTNITNVVDEEYNRRLAEIQERAQDLSDKYYAFWEKTSAPLEAAQAQIKLEQTPLEGEVSKGALQLQKAQNEAQLGLLPLQTDVTKGVLNLKKDSLPQVSELTKSFLTIRRRGQRRRMGESGGNGSEYRRLAAKQAAHAECFPPRPESELGSFH